MQTRARARSAAGGDTGASVVEYALILVGVAAVLVAVAVGLRSVMNSSFTKAQTTIAQDRAANVLNHVGAIAPTHLVATAGDTRITLTWDDMPDSTSYTVTNCGTTTAPSLSGSTWTVLCTGLTNGTPYVVAVTATGPGGTSAPSTAIATPQPPPPATPLGVSATAGDRRITVTWNASPTATSYTVTGCGSAIQYPTDRTQTGATCTALINGTTYPVSVAATNASGSSAPSGPVSATPMPPSPGAPATLTASPGPGSGNITLNWAASASATGYKVYGCGGAPITITTPVTTYLCTGLINGTAYNVYVTATNLSGESGPSPTATATPLAAPTAPTNLKSAPGNRTIVLTWDAMPRATSYSIIGCGTTITPSATPSGTTATCIGLTSGASYTISVTATGPGGTSAPSTITDMVPIPITRGTNWTQSYNPTNQYSYVNNSCTVTPAAVGVTCGYTANPGADTLRVNTTNASVVGTIFDVTWTFRRTGPTQTYPLTMTFIIV